MNELGQEIMRSSIGLLFGIVQAGSIALFVAAFRLWSDVKKLQRDLDAAFMKVRALERDTDLLWEEAARAKD